MTKYTNQPNGSSKPTKGEIITRAARMFPLPSDPRRNLAATALAERSQAAFILGAQWALTTQSGDPS